MGSYASRVANAVSTAVAESGIPLLKLAETTSIPRTTLMRRLSGASAFTVDELEAIAQALNVDLLDLLAVEEVPA